MCEVFVLLPAWFVKLNSAAKFLISIKCQALAGAQVPWDIQVP